MHNSDSEESISGGDKPKDVVDIKNITNARNNVNGTMKIACRIGDFSSYQQMSVIDKQLESLQGRLNSLQSVIHKFDKLDPTRQLESLGDGLNGLPEQNERKKKIDHTITLLKNYRQSLDEISERCRLSGEEVLNSSQNMNLTLRQIRVKLKKDEDSSSTNNSRDENPETKHDTLVNLREMGEQMNHVISCIGNNCMHIASDIASAACEGMIASEVFV